eukprot:scaffold4010_cov104-Isochrysis_galbana.AAC.2
MVVVVLVCMGGGGAMEVVRGWWWRGGWLWVRRAGTGGSWSGLGWDGGGNGVGNGVGCGRPPDRVLPTRVSSAGGGSLSVIISS